MTVKIDEQIWKKIKNSPNGVERALALEHIIGKVNNCYNRGTLHGFLLALTTDDVISNYEAISILEQFYEEK